MKFVENYKIEDIKMWENNPRKNDEAVEKLIPLLKKYGVINPVIIDQHGILRAGHTRIKALKKMGRETVPALIVEFKDEAHAIAYSIADNKSTEWAEWDYEGLKEILEELDTKDFDLTFTGFDMVEVESILNSDSIDIDSFFEEKEKNNEVKKNNIIICPHCGEKINLDDVK